MEIERNTLCKAERLNSQLLLEKLFSGGSKSLAAFPLRVVFTPIERNEDAYASILVSVPKKRFRRAVKRNRVKRQIREAYRTQKHALLQFLSDKDYSLAIAFIWLSDELVDSKEVHAKVQNLLCRIVEKLA